jgi:sugar/nucleoside kinase (ribokinase family)
MPVWPVDSFTWGTNTWVEAIEQNIGGNGGNTSSALAKLGVPVRLYGRVGRDAQAETVLGLLREAGVDTAGVGRSDHPTTTVVCVVNRSGDRLFLQRAGASADVTPEIVAFDDGAPFTHFHLANLFSVPSIRGRAVEMLRRARGAGLTTSLDTGWDALGRWMEDVAPSLPFVDLLFANETEASHLTGERSPERAAAVFIECGAGDVAIKLGGSGCAVFSESGAWEAPAYAVEAVDTTGAGDCFVAGFLAALHRGRDYEFAAQFANAVGAMSVQRLGSVCGTGTWDETMEWMRGATLVR